MAILWNGEAGADQYQVTLWLEADEGSISVEDADVLAILEGISPSA